MKVLVQSGNYSNAATWGSVSNTPSLHASTVITITNTDNFSDVFTAPSTSDACLGAYLPVNAIGTRDWVLTLQEYNGSSWVDKTSVTVTYTLLTATAWPFFKFATPYTYTTTTAGYYRFKLRTALSSSGSVRAASGGTTIGCIAVDNRTGVPASNENVFLSGGFDSAITDFTLTLDGTITLGDGNRAEVAVLPNILSFANAMQIGRGAIVVADTSAPVSMTVDGNILGNGGDFIVGSEGTPYPQNFTLTFIEDTGGDFGIRTFAGGGKFQLFGQPKSSINAKYVSGVGTAANPLIIDRSVDWVVGDQIKVTTTGTTGTAYQECEDRYIITKNSDTSFVLSNTLGGAENALTYTHTTSAHVLNLTRNIVITTNNGNGWFFYTSNTTLGNVNLGNSRLEKVGAVPTIVDKEGIKTEVANGSILIDGGVIYNWLYNGLLITTTKVEMTINDLIVCNGSGATNTYGLYFTTGSNNRILNNCYVVDNARYGAALSTSYNFVFNNCVFNANNKGNSTTSTIGSFNFALCGGVTMNNCEFNGNRVNNIYLSSGTDVIFNNCTVGGISPASLVDVYITITENFNRFVFNNCKFGSATLVQNYQSMTPGSELAFHNLNQVENNHVWYTITGIARSTGAGLVDTTVRIPGTLNVRIAPEDNASGFVWTFKVLATPSQALSVPIFIQKNATYGSDSVVVNLYLPGSILPDDTLTLSNITDSYQAAVLHANYTGSVPAYATIEIVAKSVAAGAYIYVADIMNGTNDITNLKTWEAGKPSPIMFEQLGDAIANGIAARDAILEATLASNGNTAETYGWLLKKLRR